MFGMKAKTAYESVQRLQQKQGARFGRIAGYALVLFVKHTHSRIGRSKMNKQMSTAIVETAALN